MNGEIPELPETPEGWSVTSVRPIVTTLQYGISTKADADESTGLPILRMGNIQDGKLDLSDLKYVPCSKDLAAVRLARGDVLFNRTNSPNLVGKSAVVEGDQEMVFASYLIRLVTRADVAIPKYLCWWINSAWGREWAARVKTDGVSQSNINGTVLGDMPVPLAPLAEQRRIVEKVEALLKQVNRAKERLERVPLILKRFRQAVLAAACSGELTREWRDQAGIGHSSWTTARVGDRCPVIQYGYTASARAGSTGPRFLRITDIQGGRVNWSNVPTCDINSTDAAKYALHSGDIVFARSGATTGKSFLITDCPPSVFASYLIRVRPGPLVTAAYLHLCFQTPEYWEYVIDNMAGNAQPNCNASKLADLEIRIPSKSEQAEIVSQVETLFVFVDAIERRIAAAASRAETLPQAILSKAFSGDLVPTEAELARAEGRTFETAEEMLEKVTACAPAAAKRRRGKTA